MELKRFLTLTELKMLNKVYIDHLLKMNLICQERHAQYMRLLETDDEESIHLLDSITEQYEQQLQDPALR